MSNSKLSGYIDKNNVQPMKVLSAFSAIVLITIVFRWLVYGHTPLYTIYRMYLKIRKCLFVIGIAPARQHVQVTDEVNFYDSENNDSRMGSTHSNKDPSRGILVTRSNLTDKVGELLDKEKINRNDERSIDDFEAGSSFGALTDIDGRRASMVKKISKDIQYGDDSISMSITETNDHKVSHPNESKSINKKKETNKSNLPTKGESKNVKPAINSSAEKSNKSHSNKK